MKPSDLRWLKISQLGLPKNPGMMQHMGVVGTGKQTKLGPEYPVINCINSV